MILSVDKKYLNLKIDSKSQFRNFLFDNNLLETNIYCDDTDYYGTYYIYPWFHSILDKKDFFLIRNFSKHKEKSDSFFDYEEYVEIYCINPLKIKTGIGNFILYTGEQQNESKR